MKVTLAALALALVGGQTPGVLGLTRAQLERVEKVLTTVVDGHAVPATVRLAFHDCVGGCDGCVNLQDPLNAGLDEIIEELEDKYVEHDLSSIISRADYWVYGSYLALKKAVDAANAACYSVDCIVPHLDMEFKSGRKDCSTSPYTEGNSTLPDSDFNHKELFSYFKREFNFTTEETVALMGVHTLGTAEPQNSGYKGSWVVGGFNRFNNQYYKILSNPANYWEQMDVSSDPLVHRFQWNAMEVGFMLNADMCMYRDIELNKVGESGCAYMACNSTSTSRLVEKYASSNSAWISDFAAVYNKLISFGNFTLEPVAY